jgi:hypothetical protein
VIDVAHDGDHGRASRDRSSTSVCCNLVRGLFFVADLVGGGAEIARQVFGQLHVQRLVDGGEDFLFHQLLDHQIPFDAELFGKLFDGDAFGDGDLAIDGRRLETCSPRRDMGIRSRPSSCSITRSLPAGLAW